MGLGLLTVHFTTINPTGKRPINFSASSSSLKTKSPELSGALTHFLIG